MIVNNFQGNISYLGKKEKIIHYLEFKANYIVNGYNGNK